jgi:acetyl-CoA acetyltransferase
MAGLKPQDIDVAQIYDCFTIAALMTLEAYGFCAKGQGGKFVEGGRIELGGELPINTAGRFAVRNRHAWLAVGAGGCASDAW